METQNKYNIYIGLLKQDMKTTLNKSSVIKIITKKFLDLNILGFNIEDIKGFWNGQKEDALKISFINTFNIKLKDLIILLESLKKELNQESILLETEKQINYLFV